MKILNKVNSEDEQELIPICKQYGVSLTPYSPLAAGRLSRLEWTTHTKRSQTDKIINFKYDSISVFPSFVDFILNLLQLQ